MADKAQDNGSMTNSRWNSDAEARDIDVWLRDSIDQRRRREMLAAQQSQRRLLAAIAVVALVSALVLLIAAPIVYGAMHEINRLRLEPSCPYFAAGECV